MMAPQRTIVMLLPIILAVAIGLVLPAALIILLIRALLKYLRSDREPEPWNRWRYRQSPPDVAQSLGESLKSRRTGKGFTQEYVAEALGVSRQAVSKWENGTSEPSTANLMALAKLYGLSVDELLRQVETSE